MTDGKPYTYVILRYRHDPLAGEFVNVGVVLHCPVLGFLDLKVRRSVGRLTRMFPDLRKSDLTDALQTVERGMKRLRERELSGLFSASGDAATFARRVLPQDDSSLLWSNIGSGVTRNPEETLDKLFIRFVGMYDEEPRVARDDAAVWQPVRERLAARNLADRLKPKTIISPVDTVDFDFAWKNGAWHCYQPLSFDLASGENIRDKAAKWSGHMTGVSRAEERVRPYFIVGAPADPALEIDYRRAIELLKASSLQPEVFEEGEAESLVRMIESEVISHDAAEAAAE